MYIYIHQYTWLLGLIILVPAAKTAPFAPIGAFTCRLIDVYAHLPAGKVHLPEAPLPIFASIAPAYTQMNDRHEKVALKVCL